MEHGNLKCGGKFWKKNWENLLKANYCEPECFKCHLEEKHSMKTKQTSQWQHLKVEYLKYMQTVQTTKCKQKTQVDLFSIVLCLILCYKRNGSCFGMLHRLWLHLGSWESTKKSRIALGYRLDQLLRFFMLSQHPVVCASITRWSTPNHEPFLKYSMSLIWLYMHHL